MQQFRRFQFREVARPPLTKFDDVFPPPLNPVAMVINPHDDDGALAFGLTIQALIEAGVTVQVIVTTDGRQGYCTDQQRATITTIRRKETLAGYAMLGVKKENIRFLEYPCSNLVPAQGRKHATASSEGEEFAGYTGLQNSYTWLLREHRPGLVLIPHPADYHPDHRLVYQEFLISMFHAQGNIWPELGVPLVQLPLVVEGAIYCPFPESPDLGVQAMDPEGLEAKLAAIAEWRSQTQIVALVDRIRRAGPYEFLRRVPFRLYEPGEHVTQFGF